MSPKQRTHSTNFDLIKEQMHPNTPDIVVDLVARQVDRADDAAKRIEEEGGVVRDLRGVVLPHPAIAIEASATKNIAEMILKYKQGAFRAKTRNR